MAIGETKAYYSEDESAKRERGTRDGLLFAVLVPDRQYNADRSSLQGEYLARMCRPHLSAIQAPKAVRPSSVAPPVQGSCVIVNSCRSLTPMPSGQRHQEAGPHVIRSQRSVHPSMKFVRFFFLFGRKIELKLDDQDPSSLRPTHSTSTGSSDSASELCVWLQLTLVTSFQAMITIVPVVRAKQTLASPRRIIFDHISEKVIF